MENVQKVIHQVTDKTSSGHRLPTAKLGKHGPQVTRLGYGTMGLVRRHAESEVAYKTLTMRQSAFYGQAKPDAERFKVLDEAYAAGELFWDTADMYQDSEDLLGGV